MTQRHLWFLSFLMEVAVLACTPQFQKGYPLQGSNPLGGPSQPGALAKVAGKMPDTSSSSAPSPQPATLPSNAAIYPVNRQTFCVRLPEAEVWDAAINVLLRNYNLMTIDKPSGVLTTEWDSFYLQEQLLRNKVSLRVTPAGYNQTYLSIINNVEELKQVDAGPAAGVWLPADDSAGESVRIIKSIASTLGLPTPQIPAEMAQNSPPL